MRYPTIIPLIWGTIYGSSITVNGFMSPFSQKHCRLSLISSLWLSAEYEPFRDMNMANDYIPFAIYNQDPIAGEDEALGVPGLVFEEDRASYGAMSDYTGYVEFENKPGFIKCSYKLNWYSREVEALLAISQLDPETPTIPPWKGYAKAMPLRSLINHALTYFRTGDGFGCVVLELIDGVTLREYVWNMSPLQKDVELRDVVRQLLMGLEYLHSSSWIHGDIKPDNIMIHTVPQRSDGQPRVHVTLIDFNLSFPLINGITPTIGHTMGYTPPEYYSRGQKFTFTVDSWSLGATLYLLFTGKAPYEYTYTDEGERTSWPTKKCKEFMRNLLEHQQHSYAPLNCSSDARDFIETLLHVDPANRPTMRELMWHRWLK